VIDEYRGVSLSDGSRRAWRYLAAVAACGAATMLSLPLRDFFAPANVVMIYLLAVVLIAWRCGAGPAIMAAVLSVLLFDFFFVPPHLSFAVADAQYLVTFVVMLSVALVIGQLTAKLRTASQLALARERLTRALYEMARGLSGVVTLEQVGRCASDFLKENLGARAVLLVADRDDRLRDVGSADFCAAAFSAELANNVFDSGDSADFDGIVYLPLRAPMRRRGVLVAVFEREHPPRDDRRAVLETVASMTAIAIERIHYVDVAQEALLNIKSEQLRSSILSALSHDMRTPLTALLGLADSLAKNRTLAEAHRATAEVLRQQAKRLNNLVFNLLDMARFESGAVHLRREWQPLEEVVGACLKDVEGDGPGRHVRVDLAGDLPLLSIDAVLIERVLFNLLDNAQKYGRGQITLAAVRRDEAVEVSVSDEGPGIPPGNTSLFDKFVRGHGETDRVGVGLGLAICRAIVEAHGGMVSARNRLEGGACFGFVLPVGDPPPVDSATLAKLERDVS
jgi:two-component system sensor histidine kinase KdpD